jgi:hypothetical protein
MLLVSSGAVAVVASWAGDADEVRQEVWPVALLVAAFYALALPMMSRTPLDGDEPFYLLATESIIRDHDLELRNQYANLSQSETGRLDLKPQLGDPIGPNGELYSRHEPLLALLLVPGYLVAGKSGAVASISLLGVLLAASMAQLLRESGFSSRTTTFVVLTLALTQPLLVYGLRIWPEVPAALCLSEALRAMQRNRRGQFLLMTALLSLLKLRFVAIALPLLILFFRKARLRARYLIAAALMLAVPLLIVWALSGSPLNVHDVRELHIASPHLYLVGFFGLLLDGQRGLAFVAPLLFVALLALFRRDAIPEPLRIGAFAAIPYLVLLFPRGQWHGGWSPALRYLVVFAPLFALLLARAVDRHLHPALVGMAGAGSAALTLYALAHPARLFHIENGEARFGEFVSALYGSDFSRLIPSYIRVSAATFVAVAVLIAIAAVVMLRRRTLIGVAAPLWLTIALVIFFIFGTKPGKTIELEDAHVAHSGGELFPHEWEAARFNFDGGWRVKSGALLRFGARPGPARLRYTAETNSLLVLDGKPVALPATRKPGVVAVTLQPRDGRSELSAVSGDATLDRIDHD